MTQSEKERAKYNVLRLIVDRLIKDRDNLAQIYLKDPTIQNQRKCKAAEFAVERCILLLKGHQN